MTEYLDLENLGEGGFGQVTKCQRQSDGQYFAKKQLLEHTDADAVARFQREVRILSSLDHPNVVRVVDLRLHEEPYYCILPLYSGSLEDNLADINTDKQRIFEVFKRILDGVEYAHGEGIVHRDLKPDNVLMNSNVDIVVSDFGLGRRIDADTTRKTQTGVGIGTVFYMPPEQFSDFKRADHRSDIYSLGRILYSMNKGPLSSITQDLTDLPAGIGFIIERCTKHDPNQRFQSVSELKDAWYGLFDSSNRDAEIQEIVEIRTRLSVVGEMDAADVSRFIQLMRKYYQNSDMLHESVMQLSTGAFQRLLAYDPNFTKQLIRDFCEHVTKQGWPFSYTDKIADKALQFFRATEDHSIRPALIACVMELGAMHNRWHVLGVFRDMLSQQLSADEYIILEGVLSNADPYVKEQAAPYVSMDKVPTRLGNQFL